MLAWLFTPCLPAKRVEAWCGPIEGSRQRGGFLVNGADDEAELVVGDDRDDIEKLSRFSPSLVQLHIDKITGHAEEEEDDEADVVPVDSVKRKKEGLKECPSSGCSTAASGASSLDATKQKVDAPFRLAGGVASSTTQKENGTTACTTTSKSTASADGTKAKSASSGGTPTVSPEQSLKDQLTGEWLNVSQEGFEDVMRASGAPYIARKVAKVMGFGVGKSRHRFSFNDESNSMKVGHVGGVAGSMEFNLPLDGIERDMKGPMGQAMTRSYFEGDAVCVQLKHRPGQVDVIKRRILDAETMEMKWIVQKEGEPDVICIRIWKKQSDPSD
ncbi:unnamed protein product [Amoebophrya sp. A25]|nr:unnamed protein product [Amoebophrya sp. A25]|eukprot:GSA25T00007659001.1